MNPLLRTYLETKYIGRYKVTSGGGCNFFLYCGSEIIAGGTLLYNMKHSSVEYSFIRWSISYPISVQCLDWIGVYLVDESEVISWFRDKAKEQGLDINKPPKTQIDVHSIYV